MDALAVAVTSGEILPHVRSGDVRLLAMLQDAEIEEFPDAVVMLPLMVVSSRAMLTVPCSRMIVAVGLKATRK